MQASISCQWTLISWGKVRRVGESVRAGGNRQGWNGGRGMRIVCVARLRWLFRWVHVGVELALLGEGGRVFLGRIKLEAIAKTQPPLYGDRDCGIAECESAFVCSML